MTNIKPVVVDAHGHLLGRLAALLAKELLNGQRVVVVRCEDINISGSLFRNKLKWEHFLRKRMNTNPRHGPFHYRAPARMLWRTIRGMIPHKTKRGAAALDRLRVFEGVPHPFDKVKRQVVPDALRNLRLRPGRKYCRLGDLAKAVGWRYADIITRLEEARKVRSHTFHNKKVILQKLRKQAYKNVAEKIKPVTDQLTAFGYTTKQ